MKIGIIGLAGAGKDEVAGMLSAINGYPVKRYASKLKLAARNVFGEHFDDRKVKEVSHYVNPDHMLECTFNMLSTILTDEELLKAGELYDEHLGLRTNISPREYQQILGTEVGRAIDKEVWVRAIKNSKGDCIVPDVRFGGELLDKNILVVRKGLAVPTNVHSSEALAVDLMKDMNMLDTVDHVIYNNGTLGDLYAKVFDLNKLMDN